MASLCCAPSTVAVALSSPKCAACPTVISRWPLLILPPFVERHVHNRSHGQVRPFDLNGFPMLGHVIGQVIQIPNRITYLVCSFRWRRTVSETDADRIRCFLTQSHATKPRLPQSLPST